MTLFCRHIQGPSPRPEALLLLVAVFVRCHTHFYHHRKELLEVNCIVTIDVQFSEQVFDIYILHKLRTLSSDHFLEVILVEGMVISLYIGIIVVDINEVAQGLLQFRRHCHERFPFKRCLEDGTLRYTETEASLGYLRL